MAGGAPALRMAGRPRGTMTTSIRRWTSFLVAMLPALAHGAELHLDRIRLPPGFSIEVYAANVKNARQMALGPGGVVFVSTRREGNVYALLDTQKKNKADRVVTHKSSA